VPSDTATIPIVIRNSPSTRQRGSMPAVRTTNRYQREDRMEHFGHIPDPPKARSQPQPTELDKSWVLARIEMILAGYRKADYHDPEMFMAQVAMNLMKFPQEIIEYVSAPETGIQTRLQCRQVSLKFSTLASPNKTTANLSAVMRIVRSRRFCQIERGICPMRTLRQAPSAMSVKAVSWQLP
jgi:hypothetical protein